MALGDKVEELQQTIAILTGWVDNDRIGRVQK